jgi:hypothetical protein
MFLGIRNERVRSVGPISIDYVTKGTPANAAVLA